MKFKIALISVVASAIIFFMGFKVGANYPKLKGSLIHSQTQEIESDQVYASVSGIDIYGSEILPKINESLILIEKSKYELKKNAVIEVIRAKLNFNQMDRDAWKNYTVSKDELMKFMHDRGISESKLSKIEIESITNNMKMAKAIEAKKIIDDKAFKQLKIDWKIPNEEN